MMVLVLKADRNSDQQGLEWAKKTQLTLSHDEDRQAILDSNHDSSGIFDEWHRLEALVC